jgi:type IV pilus secretin PilQ/predicted competence protein
MDVRKVFEVLSRQSTLNILVSPNVAGRVTVDLKDVSVDGAIEVVAELCHLQTRREGNLVYVFTLADKDEKEEQDLPIRIYHLAYTKGTDLEKMIKPLLSKRGVLTSTPESEMGIKTDFDKAGDDSMAGGDVLVVQDHERVLKAVDRVVAQLDVQPIQVLIEAIIVSVKLENGLDLGVNFGVVDNAATTLGVLGSGAAINAATGFTPAQVLTAGGKVVGDKYSGFAEDIQGVKFGFIDKNATGFIRALRTFAETKILASPRLLVLNKQRAEIQLGDRLGYKTLTQTQTSTTEKVEFMNVGTQLRLRPFVSSDGLIRMEIHPERSSGVLENGVPQTTSAQVTTNVMVPDGATLVIGGLMKDEKDITRSGIPLLCDLPIVGPLFRRTEEKLVRKELIVILTPRIWSQAIARELNGEPPPRCEEEARARAGIPPSCDDGKDKTLLRSTP